MRTFTGLDMVQRLLAGTLSGAQLETALTTDAALYLGPWRELFKAKELNAVLNSPTAFAAIFGSNTAFTSILDSRGELIAGSDAITTQLAASPSAALLIVSSTTYLNLWNNTPANKSRLQALYNQSGSCFVRYAITSGTSWELPDGNIAKASIAIAGAGGNARPGQSAATAYGGPGGSGAQIKSVVIADPITSAVTVQVGSDLDSVFGSTTALKGISPETNISSSTGPGSDSGSFYDVSFDDALFQTSGEKKGGNGGPGGFFQNPTFNPGSPGTAGVSGAGGAGGTAPSLGGISGGGGAGTGFGSGGGGGGACGGTTGLDGTSTSQPGCGGGGGGVGSTPGNGGTGGPGKIWVYGVLAAPKA